MPRDALALLNQSGTHLDTWRTGFTEEASPAVHPPPATAHASLPSGLELMSTDMMENQLLAPRVWPLSIQTVQTGVIDLKLRLCMPMAGLNWRLRIWAPLKPRPVPGSLDGIGLSQISETTQHHNCTPVPANTLRQRSPRHQPVLASRREDQSHAAPRAQSPFSNASAAGPAKHG